jgi:hypothetical protein
LLIIGGVVSVPPGLGIWMLPLGLLFIALDVPFLCKPNRTLHDLERGQMGRARTSADAI